MIIQTPTKGKMKILKISLVVLLVIYAVLVACGENFNEQDFDNSEDDSFMEESGCDDTICSIEIDYSDHQIQNLTAEEIDQKDDLVRQISIVNSVTERTIRPERVESLASMIVDACPQHALDVYLIGVAESYSWNPRRYEGDFRIHYPLESDCTDCFCTQKGCYSSEDCDPDQDENCFATSCGPFHVRHVFHNFTCEEIKDERFATEWICNWFDMYYPNIAAVNAGIRGSTQHDKSDDYGYRHFILRELATSNRVPDPEQWSWGQGENQRRIVYQPGLPN